MIENVVKPANINIFLGICGCSEYRGEKERYIAGIQSIVFEPTCDPTLGGISAARRLTSLNPENLSLEFV